MTTHPMSARPEAPQDVLDLANKLASLPEDVQKAFHEAMAPLLDDLIDINPFDLAEQWCMEAQAAKAELATRDALLKEAVEVLTGRPDKMLDAEELDTISACVRNGQHGRILGLELWELIRSYRAVRVLLEKIGSK